MLRTRWIVPALAGAVCLSLAAASHAQEVERLTLKQAVALAVQNSYELALAHLRLAAAADTARMDRSQFLPNLYTGSGAAFTHGFPQTPGGGAPSVFNLSYAQTLFNPPLRGQARAAEDRARGERMALDGARDNVILRTASDYLELVKVRGSLEWLRKERDSAQKVMDVTRERAAAGLQLPIEITRAELTRARMEQRLVGLEGREDALEEDLRSLTGVQAGKRLEVASTELPEVAERGIGEMVQLALANSPDLKRAEQERRARQDIFRGERGGYWPSIDLVGQYSVLSKVNNFEDFFRRFERNNVDVGVQIQIPIFSSRISSAVALARSQLRAAELDLGNRQRVVAAEVGQRARKTRELEAARAVARLELKLAQENLAVLQAQFDQGRANLADLERARLNEGEKWLSFLDADFKRQQGQLELLKTTGQLAQAFP